MRTSKFLPLPLFAGVFVVASTACRPSPTPTPAATASSQTNSPPPQVAAPLVPIEPISAGARIEDERNTISIVKNVAASVVFVTQKRVQYDPWQQEAEEVKAGSGSGFVWDSAGHIVTNYHVVAGADSLSITFQNQKSYDAQIVGIAPEKDTAVLKIVVPAGETLVPIRFPGTMQLEVGQKTVAIGNPFGLDHSVSTGIISALGREALGAGGVPIRDMIQTDAAINPGNSGGPLLDSAGQLIGMNTQIVTKSGTSSGVGLAIPVSTIARVVPQIIKNGVPDRVCIGFKVYEGRTRIKGVIVERVFPGTPAERAGLRGLQTNLLGRATLGDVLVGVDEKTIDSFQDLYTELDKHNPGDKVTLKLQREGKPVPVPVDLVQCMPQKRVRAAP